MAQDKAIVWNEDGSASLTFQANVYSLTAIKKAAYKFTDRAAVLISGVESGCVHLRFAIKSAQDDVTKQQILDSFCNEVLDQDLREAIAIQTEATRSLILAQAFSKTSLLE